MYGIPHDLDLGGFIGATPIQICLGEFQVQFRFQAAEGMLSIGVEGGWALRDERGESIDHSEPNAERKVYRVHRLLGQAVVATDLDAPRSFALRFASGDELRIFDDSDRYESFSIQPGDIFV